MFGIKKIKKECAELKEENEQLRRLLDSQNKCFKQWENLLQYDGSEQGQGLTEGEDGLGI